MMVCVIKWAFCRANYGSWEEQMGRTYTLCMIMCVCARNISIDTKLLPVNFLMNKSQPASWHIFLHEKHVPL